MKISMILKRVCSDDDGTYGTLIVDDKLITLTLEESWLKNKQDESCIPEGSYICKRVISGRFGETFMVEEVPDRTNILFHWGNTEKDTKGCILLGLMTGQLYTVDDDSGDKEWQPAILSSKIAFNKFMNLLIGEDFFALTIMDV